MIVYQNRLSSTIGGNREMDVTSVKYIKENTKLHFLP